MTKPKQRTVKTHTQNVAISFAASDIQAKIVGIIKEYFEDIPAIEETLSLVWEAVTEYGLAFDGNPDRKNTQEQRLDTTSPRYQ